MSSPADAIAPVQVSYHLPGASAPNPPPGRPGTVDIIMPHHPRCSRRNAPIRHASPRHASLADHVAVLAGIMAEAYAAEGLRMPPGLRAACGAAGTPALRLIPGGAG